MYKNISGIYKITSPTGKVYIGQSYNIHLRYTRYKHLSCKNQDKLYNSLKKYGFENHTFEVLQQAPKNELNQLEINYIWRHNALDREHGLNLKDGGYNGKLTQESIDKIRKKAFGRKASKETKAKMSKTKTGKVLLEKHKAHITKVNQERCSIKVYTIRDNKRIVFDSMSEAAKLTNYSIASISNQIKRLEKGLKPRLKRKGFQFYKA